IYKMMKSLQHRGLDSAGVAIYQRGELKENEYILMALVKDIPGTIGKIGNAIGAAGGDIRNIQFNPSPLGGVGTNKYIVRVRDRAALEKIIENINKTGVGDVISCGSSINIFKELGDVENLERGYGLQGMRGTHGLGHVRFSTESIVDRIHAHPFQAPSIPDIAIVHNGQITNHNKIRRMLERKGHRFSSGNDTEVILHYIVEQIKNGHSLREALEQSIEDLDGPFSYIISTSSAIGMARDKLGLRPAMFSKDSSGYYMASEESALVSIGKDVRPAYLEPGEVLIYERKDD
ncbi:MAG: glutamine amidotransferase, partial [Candidatus Hadarchaeales archaeon]